MEEKIITEEDFWVCTEGAIPTQFQGTRELLHDQQGEAINYITKEDKATVGWLDFGCKKLMLLYAIIAAVAVVAAVALGVATVATGGAALIAVCAIAGLVGGAIGGIVGGLICGQLMEGAREWQNYKDDMIIQGSYTITESSVMTCRAGGVIRYAPNIKSWSDAIDYAVVSYSSELFKCACVGALIGTIGTLCGVGASAVPGTGGTVGTGINFANRAMSLAKPTFGSVMRNVGMSFGPIGSFGRLLAGGESAQYTHATGGINRQGEYSTAEKEFLNSALPEYEFVNRIRNEGLSGLQPTDALFLLYLLNLKVDPPGTFRDVNGILKYARGNPQGKPTGTTVPNRDNPRPRYRPTPSNGKPLQNGNGRRSWQQSEAKVGEMYDGYNSQKSFIDGQEVPYGTAGSTRPDLYKPGHSVEVKNYDLSTTSNRSNLVNEVTRQYNQRVVDLPSGTRQTVVIDIKGQNVSATDIVNVNNQITTNCPNMEVIFISQ